MEGSSWWQRIDKVGDTEIRQRKMVEGGWIVITTVKNSERWWEWPTSATFISDPDYEWCI